MHRLWHLRVSECMCCHLPITYYFIFKLKGLIFKIDPLSQTSQPVESRDSTVDF